MMSSDAADRDRIPAHELWIELSTRITTQALHFRSGDEETAAESIHKLFDRTRELMRENPEAAQFLKIAMFLLNDVLRPYTARWQGWLTEVDRESNQAEIKPRFRDEWVRRQFRRELRDLQPRLICFKNAFKAMKDGKDAWSWLGELSEKQKKIQQEECRPGKNAHLGGKLTPGIGDQVRFTGKTYEEQRELVAKINTAEHGEIRKRRGFGPDHRLTDMAGVAFSGGGIRSATFCLGITQVLTRRGLFGGFDYMSTVSGGGYFGSFLSAYLGTGGEAVEDTSEKGLEQAAAKRVEQTFVPDENDLREQRPIRHLRNRSRYLVDGGFRRTARNLGMVLVGVFVNLLLVLPLPLVAAAFTLGLKWLKPWDYDWFATEGAWFPALDLSWGLLLIVPWTVLAFCMLIYPVVRACHLHSGGKEKGGWLGIWRWTATCVARVTLIVSVLWILPAAFRLFGLAMQWGQSSNLDWAGLFKSIASGATVIAALSATVSRSEFIGTVGRWLRRLAILSAPLLFAFIYFHVGSGLMSTWSQVSCGVVLWIAAAILFWGVAFMDVNAFSPHTYYRQRLCECYLIQRGGTEQGSEVTLLPRLRLSDLGQHPAAPYHLINTTVNLPSSEERELHGRQGDFFLISRHYCGSPVCGYHATGTFENLDPHLDLGTAMAVSGAAASSNMGWKTMTSLRFLMTLANVRLGYWLRDPARQRSWFGPFGPSAPYLLSEMFAWMMDEKRAYLNLSDGGHIENLAVYELLRRRCKFIVCVDGGKEPGMECADLMRLERYAAIDLGIRMHYDLSDLELQANGYSHAYGILVKIDYRPPRTESERRERPLEKAEWGWMLYLKLSMVGYGPGYVMDYKAQHPAFPHETTGDQIYDEAQFEAYRALGEAAAESFFTTDITPDGTPKTIEKWFESLASNLLPDNDEAFR